MLNRNYWKILDEELEELNIYYFSGLSKKEKQQINKNVKNHRINSVACWISHPQLSGF